MDDLPDTHMTPASSECTQLWLPIALAGQSISLDSVPTHWTSSSQIDPVPAPKAADGTAIAPICTIYEGNEC